MEANNGVKMTLGEKLKSAGKSAGLTQEQLAVTRCLEMINFSGKVLFL